jgi:patatin-like phospholipase
MSEGCPLRLSQVLREEYQLLRSEAEASYEPSDASAPESALLTELFQKVHQQSKPFSALCISGGGIRSATFALGALQSMADHGYLGEFDYLSTVSGGGYIGSWLTAWIQRVGGLANVAPELRRTAPKPGPGAPDPIQHLRDYNNYLTPKLGLFSADTWTVAATVIRNMVLNWLVLVPLLLFALMGPRMIVALLQVDWHFADQVPPSWWGGVLKVAQFLTYALFALGVFNAVRYLPGVGNVPHSQGKFLRNVLAPLVTSYVLHCAHYWWSPDTTTIWQEIRDGLISSFGGWFAYLLIYVAPRNVKRFLRLLIGRISLAMLLVGVGVGAFAWVALVKIYFLNFIHVPQFVALGPPVMLLGFSMAGALFVGATSRILEDPDREWFSRAGAWMTLFILLWAGLCSLVLLVPDFILRSGPWIQSASAGMGALSGWAAALAGFSGKTKVTPNSRETKTESWQLGLALKLAPFIFLLFFFVGLAIVTNVILDATGLVQAAWWDHAATVGNSSLLSTVVLAAVFLVLGMIAAYFININLFSLNSMYRNRLIRAYLGASNPKRNANVFTGFAENDNMRMREIDTTYKPFHVLNLTLNLVAGERLAWQQRKAESFTVSPQHCGSRDLGYRPSAKYCEGITLGTAMAISGAAASPNMGYHSSPVVGFIMTLFNARLGAWLGNPGIHGKRTWKLRGPRSAVGSLVKEAFGLTNDTSKYVYLSDGGHFENLGLYEMVLRRCRHIVVLDSGADPCFTYEDLGNAIRKIRIDMNIPIDFEEGLGRPLQSGKKRCAVARIGYSKVDGKCEDGYLIYVKPMYLGNECPDVQSYHAEKPEFPQQSTAEQWFDESQTESYRMLGLQTLGEISRGMKDPATLEHLREAAEEYIKKAESGAAFTAGV